MNNLNEHMLAQLVKVLLIKNDENGCRFHL